VRSAAASTTHNICNYKQRYYIPSARELQRIESITRSPIYSKFSEALAGVATIRAYRREDYFTAASDQLMELNAYAFVTQRAAAAWLAMRLDFMGLIILTCAGAQLGVSSAKTGCDVLSLMYWPCLCVFGAVELTFVCCFAYCVALHPLLLLQPCCASPATSALGWLGCAWCMRWTSRAT
jgi:ABC-type multidrug transport system fused ATPase/permease subunit